MTVFLKFKSHLRFWPLAAALLLPNLAFAGGKATITTATPPIHIEGQDNEAGADRLTLTWRDANTLRMEFGDPNHYMVMRDGKTYSVTLDGDGAQVMDMAGMSAMIQAMNPNKEDDNPFGDSESMKATSEHKTVAGIKGRVYQMQWNDPEESKPKSSEVVLTNDPLVIEMTHAYFNSMSAMIGAKYIDIFKDNLPAKASGLLQVGDDFTVESITKADPAAALFELPAKPMGLQSLLGGMSQ